MFNKFFIETNDNLFDELSTSTKFENVINGRQGTIILDYDSKNDLIPIVRSTTIYNTAAQKFLSVHYDIIDKIKQTTKYDNLEFNNALIEIYDTTYRNMKYHSDQALDLMDNSYICLFSCYDDPLTTNTRKLKIKEKKSGICSEIVLNHNSIVIFSLAANSNHLHKIILDSNKINNKWLGITFRLSKTYIKIINEIPYFYSNDKEIKNEESKQIDDLSYNVSTNSNTNIILKLASADERREYMKYRRNENINIEYTYPTINFTISPSDLLPVIS